MLKLFTKRLPLMVAMSALFVFVAAQSAFAQVTVPADPTGGSMEDIQTSAQSWVLTYGVPVLFGLLIFGILIRLGIKWARKAGTKIG